jgi:hypothetical protein
MITIRTTLCQDSLTFRLEHSLRSKASFRINSGGTQSNAPLRCAKLKQQETPMKASGNCIIGEPLSSVRETNNADGAVLLDIQQGICFSLNPVGAKIWALIKQRKSTDDVIASLVKEFDVPEEQIRSDVAEFAALLKQNGLLLSAGEPSAKRSGFIRSVIHRLVSVGLLLRE